MLKPRLPGLLMKFRHISLHTSTCVIFRTGRGYFRRASIFIRFNKRSMSLNTGNDLCQTDGKSHVDRRLIILLSITSLLPSVFRTCLSKINGWH